MKYGLDEKNMERLNSVFKEFSEIDEIFYTVREQRVISEKVRI